MLGRNYQTNGRFDINSNKMLDAEKIGFLAIGKQK